MTTLRHQGRPARAAAGFTLIEAMVVVAVLGILASLAAPPLANAIQRQRERNTTQELLAAVSLGRSEAMRTGRQVVLRRLEPCPQTQDARQWRCGWNMFIDLDNDEQLDANEVVLFHSAPNDAVYVVRRGPANLATNIPITPFGRVPTGLSVMVLPTDVGPDDGAEGTHVCAYGSRLRTAVGTGCN